MDNIPARLYICPSCGYGTDRRWILKNHLINVHDYRKREAIETAADCEYWANPRYTRARDMWRYMEDQE